MGPGYNSHFQTASSQLRPTEARTEVKRDRLIGRFEEHDASIIGARFVGGGRQPEDVLNGRRQTWRLLGRLPEPDCQILRRIENERAGVVNTAA